MGGFRPTRHGRAAGVHAPLALDVVLRCAKQFARGLRVALREHGVARLLVGILFERDARRFGVELKRVLPCKTQGRIVAHQRPVTGKHGILLLVQPETQVISVRDAVTVGDDERRAVVRLGFLKGLDGVRVATAHSYPRDIHVTVADGLHGQILLGRLFAAGRELRHRAAGRGFGHLPAGVGIDFRVKHQEVDVAPRGLPRLCRRPNRRPRRSRRSCAPARQRQREARGPPPNRCPRACLSARRRAGAGL